MPYYVTEEEPNKVSCVYTLKSKDELIWFLEDLAQMRIHDSKKEANEARSDRYQNYKINWKIVGPICLGLE